MKNNFLALSSAQGLRDEISKNASPQDYITAIFTGAFFLTGGFQILYRDCLAIGLIGDHPLVIANLHKYFELTNKNSEKMV